MNAQLERMSAIELARALARKIEHDPAEDSYRDIAEKLVHEAENDTGLVWELAEYGAASVAQMVQSEFRRKRDDDARARARLQAVERQRPKNGHQRQAQENRRQQLKGALEKIHFDWLTSYAVAGVKLGHCRHVELDRAVADCEQSSLAYSTKAEFLAAVRAKLKDHNEAVGNVLTHDQIAEIARDVGYTREV